MLSGYLKNYNLTDMTVRVNNYADFPASPVVTATNTWTRTGVLMQPSQMTDNFDVMVYVDGTDAAQYGFVDNIMLNYISAEDHAQGLAYCLNKYPWKV
jgi:hypothetical protein